jgi:hypothetical protein
VYVTKDSDSAYFLYMILSLWLWPTHQLSSSCYMQIGSRTHPPSCASITGSGRWMSTEAVIGWRYTRLSVVAGVNKVGEIICPKYGPPARRKSLLGMQQMRLRRRVAVSTSTNTPPHRTTSSHSSPGSGQYLVSQYAQNCTVCLDSRHSSCAASTSALDSGQLYLREGTRTN